METRAISPKFCTALHDHLRYVSAKYHVDLCKIEGARSWTKIWKHILDPTKAVAAASKPINHIHVYDPMRQKCAEIHKNGNVTLTFDLSKQIM